MPWCGDHHRVAVGAGEARRPWRSARRRRRSARRRRAAPSTARCRPRRSTSGRSGSRALRPADGSLDDVDERRDVVIGDRLRADRRRARRPPVAHALGTPPRPLPGPPELRMGIGGEQFDLEPATEARRRSRPPPAPAWCSARSRHPRPALPATQPSADRAGAISSTTGSRRVRGRRRRGHRDPNAPRSAAAASPPDVAGRRSCTPATDRSSPAPSRRWARPVRAGRHSRVADDRVAVEPADADLHLVRPVDTSSLLTASR